ncbi:hypothetical protein ABT097_16575 [Streptomyces sp. NPDC002225]|uniref:hypothetical protein n=1 Tax=Streptomyces sp. NPDC002225 TaxID=3154413 RepID=UPI003322E741
MGDGEPPEPTPGEQRAQDEQRVQGELIAADVNRQVRGVLDAFGSGRSGTSGRTSFEDHELNTLIDLIKTSGSPRLPGRLRAGFGAARGEGRRRRTS